MKILLDMNIPLKFARGLTQKGINILRWSDVGSPSAADSEIMDYARKHGYIVLTYDLDFSAVLSVTHEPKPSVAQIRSSVKYADKAVDMIVSALYMNEEELEKGAILSIDLDKSRLRLLPL